MRDYHDTEWGVPVFDERRMFEFLLLEGAQAGLSWETILKRREGYRKAFDDFDMEKIARYDEEKVAGLLADPGIIRNRLKVRSAIQNAQAALKLRDGGGDLAKFFWSFVDNTPLQPNLKNDRWPAETELSKKISKELRRLGFNFVGPVIVYAHMQAVGMTNDHMVECFRHRELCGDR
jgi:DNA-3-methyladenine glycosylase I